MLLFLAVTAVLAGVLALHAIAGRVISSIDHLDRAPRSGSAGSSR